MTPVDCLFDTSAIVKQYHGERGTKIVDYLFRSPKVTISLATIQVVEVIKTFYKKRAENEIDDTARNVAVDTFLKDISTEKIYLYDLAKRHLTDMGIYQPIADYKPIEIIYYDKKTGMTKTRTKPRPNTSDAVALIIMREIKYLNEYAGEEAYLVASDEPIIKVAETLGIKVINPEQASISTLPPSLDMREHVRRALNARAVFKDYETSQPLGTSRSEDISTMGIKVHKLPQLTPKRLVSFRLESFNENKTIKETWGEVQWQSASYCGIRLAEPIRSEHLEVMAN